MLTNILSGQFYYNINFSSHIFLFNFNSSLQIFCERSFIQMPISIQPHFSSFNFNSSLQICRQVLQFYFNLHCSSQIFFSISILLHKSAARSFNLNFVPFHKEPRLCLAVVHICWTNHGHLQYFCKIEYQQFFAIYMAGNILLQHLVTLYFLRGQSSPVEMSSFFTTEVQGLTHLEHQHLSALLHLGEG